MLSMRSAPPTEQPHTGALVREGGRAKSAAAGLSVVVWASVSAFVVLMTIAMAQYPGGNIWVRSEPGYDFWRNFWCDLLREPAYNGQPNLLAPSFAQAAMFTLAVALAAFFLIAPSLFPARRRLGALVSLLGVAGACGLALVSVVSDGQFPRLHGTTVLVAAPAGLLAVIGTLIGMLRAPARCRSSAAIGMALLAAALVSLVQFAREYAFSAPSSEWLPRSQKVATLLALVWICVVSIEAARRARRQPPGEPEGAGKGT
jgi:hypothetical protein